MHKKTFSRKNAATESDAQGTAKPGKQKARHKQSQNVVEVSSDGSVSRLAKRTREEERDLDCNAPSGRWADDDDEAHYQTPPERLTHTPRKKAKKMIRSEDAEQLLSSPSSSDAEMKEEKKKKKKKKKAKRAKHERDLEQAAAAATAPAQQPESHSSGSLEVVIEEASGQVHSEVSKRSTQGNGAPDEQPPEPVRITSGKKSPFFSDPASGDSQEVAKKKLRREKRKGKQPSRVLVTQESPGILISAAGGGQRAESAAASDEVREVVVADAERPEEDTPSSPPPPTIAALPQWFGDAPRLDATAHEVSSEDGDRQKGGHSDTDDEELRRLVATGDEELKVELPGLDTERLVLISPRARKEAVREALKLKRRAPFLDSLAKRQQEISENKRKASASGKPLGSPLASPQKPPSRRVDTPPAGAQQSSPVILSPVATGRVRTLGEDATYDSNMRISLWEPPVSPYFLIEEALYNDPWKVLVACMLLNKTTGRAVRKTLWNLFEHAPTPEAAALADPDAVERIIYSLGLGHKRARMFIRFSREYSEEDWTDPRQLHGIGQYAADAYYIFCRNQWRERPPPLDKDLRKYYDWLVETSGEGTACERETFGAPTSSASEESAAAVVRTKRGKRAAAAATDAATSEANDGCMEVD